MIEKKYEDQSKAYTKEYLAKNPQGSWRVIFNLSALIFTIIFLGTKLDNTTIAQWSVLPIMMIVGNLAVYLIHRYPLHKYSRLHPFPYVEHTVKHHSAFEYHDLDIHKFNEIPNIVFPPQVVLAFVIGYVPVVFYLSSLVLSFNASILIVMGSAIYFLLYEVMHTISHAPEGHFILKFSYFRFMKNHHRIHHHQTLMATTNFNIVYPLFDWLTGTMKTTLPEKSLKRDKARALKNVA